MPVQGSSNLPVAPRNTRWDAAAAKRRVFEACNGNVACISRAFLYRSEGDARDPKVWSMGYADMVDGRLHIIPKAIAACAGKRGIGTFRGQEEEAELIRARITSIYDRVRREYEDWPVSPFASFAHTHDEPPQTPEAMARHLATQHGVTPEEMPEDMAAMMGMHRAKHGGDISMPGGMTASIRAAAGGEGFEGPIAFEGMATGDGRFIVQDALVWDEGPWPLVFDIAEMDHSGATIGTINAIERRADGVIWGAGNLSDSANPDVQALVARAAELFSEGAVGVSVSLDETQEDCDEMNCKTTAGRIRSVAIVDEAAFSPARMALVAAADPKWFSNPNFGNGSLSHREDGGDERLVWQEPERPEEEGQYGCPLTITDDGHIYGHAALWYRCHVGYGGTCVRPPKEPASYRGYLTGERVPGIPSGPLVFKTRHAPDHLDALAAQVHYDNTGEAPADVTIGPDPYGIWVSGALRAGTTEADLDILRGSALSGDWRPNGASRRLIGILAVSAPGFRVARALAASGTIITVGPGCQSCEDGQSLEDRLLRLEAALAAAGLCADCA